MEWDITNYEALDGAEAKMEQACAASAKAENSDTADEAASDAWKAALEATEAVGAGSEDSPEDAEESAWRMVAIWQKAAEVVQQANRLREE